MNYYDVLRISPNATLIEIKNAYKVLVKRYHPDVFDGNKEFAEAKIKEINEAYEVLHNVEKKREYDEIRKTVVNSNINVNKRESSVKSRTKTTVEKQSVSKNYYGKVENIFFNYSRKGIEKLIEWYETKNLENFLIMSLVFAIICLVIKIIFTIL